MSAWHYRRHTRLRVSRWTLDGLHWVEKADADDFCLVGFNNIPTSLRMPNPKAGRAAVELALALEDQP